VNAAADVFVRPTRADGDALSVREALSLGVRTVASDAAPRPAAAFTFPTGDDHALAAAVRRALSAPAPARGSGGDGLGPLLALYEQLDIWRGDEACAVSQDA
jgi:glycosyltransferase involved in cell wall biosynthesis